MIEPTTKPTQQQVDIRKKVEDILDRLPLDALGPYMVTGALNSADCGGVLNEEETQIILKQYLDTIPKPPPEQIWIGKMVEYRTIDALVIGRCRGISPTHITISVAPDTIWVRAPKELCKVYQSTNAPSQL